ncbi:MAG TPA: amino acid permease [Candidatus Acidoferrales bacterium]|nr:amino acid permease [Candidatus Acidoferrales bacterium]
MTSQPTAFVRKASGLRRDVSLLDVVSLNLSNMSGGAALGTIGFTTVLLTSMSGVNLVYGSILAWLLTIPEVIVYTMMTTRVSRTGGDYVWVSRVYGGTFGGPLSFMGYTIETMAYMALIALAGVVAIGSVGLSLGAESCGIATCLGLALPGNIPGANLPAQFVIAALVFVILIAANMLKPKLGFKIVAVAVIVAIIATFVGIFSLLAAGTTGVQGYMSFLNSTLGAKETYASVASSYTGPTFDFGATIFMLPFFAIFVYPWLNAGPAVASEIKGKSALKYNVVISSVVSLIIVTSAFGAMYYAGGFNFINGALSNADLVYNWSFNFWTLAMGVSSTPVAAFIGLGWILWNVAIIAYAIIVLSRYLFAQSFDRFLPEKISYISPKYNSPTVAFTINLIGTLLLIGLASFFYGTLVALYGAVIASMIYFFFIGIAALRYALKNEKGTSKGILATAGLLMAIVFAYITYQFLAYASIWGGTTLGYAWAFGSFIVGVIIYFVSKSYYGKRGIDITLAYKELPPL